MTIYLAYFVHFDVYLYTETGGESDMNTCMLMFYPLLSEQLFWEVGIFARLRQNAATNDKV